MNPSLGQIAYEAYAGRVRIEIPFEELNDARKEAWEAVGIAITAVLLGDEKMPNGSQT